MAQDSLHILPRCPSCAARLPIGRLLTFDTRQVVPCKQCELQMQIDLRMTVVDWLIQTLIYVPIAVYSLYASIALIQWLEMLLMLWIVNLRLGRLLNTGPENPEKKRQRYHLEEQLNRC